MGFSWALALSLVALACSAGAFVVAGRRTPSAYARAAQKTADDTVARWESETKLFEATRERWASEFAGIAERCDELLDRTESKRRRIAATESRANAGAGAGEAAPEGGTREQVIESARARLRGVR